MSHRTKLLAAFLLLALCSGCAVHPHPPTHATWQAYQAAHPNARFVVVHTRPARDRTCWKVARGWRCVVR